MWLKRNLNIGAIFLFFIIFSPLLSDAASPVVVTLTQTPCSIVEAEKEPKIFSAKNSEDCVRINKMTIKKRNFQTLRLKPGKTIFRVTNKNVPYELGFYLRGKGLKKLMLPTVSGGGLKTGITKDYAVDLKPGEYLFSCPLNPTPDYPLVVENN